MQSVAAILIAHDTLNGNKTGFLFVPRKGAKKSTSERQPKRIVTSYKNLPRNENQLATKHIANPHLYKNTFHYRIYLLLLLP